MSAMVVNHFKMRPDVQTYHLGGMGCGNGVIGIGLVKHLLQVRGRGRGWLVWLAGWLAGCLAA